MHSGWSFVVARGETLGRSPGGFDVLDILFIATTVAFFAVSLAYVRGCDRL